MAAAMAAAKESTPLVQPLVAEQPSGVKAVFDYSISLRALTARKLQRQFGAGGRESAVDPYGMRPLCDTQARCRCATQARCQRLHCSDERGQILP
jgi:hypothetical protein